MSQPPRPLFDIIADILNGTINHTRELTQDDFALVPAPPRLTGRNMAGPIPKPTGPKPRFQFVGVDRAAYVWICHDTRQIHTVPAYYYQRMAGA